MGEPLDRRSDLYGIGAILFELVAGRRMWSGETDLEHLRQLALADAPRLAEAMPDAPRELGDLQARLVAKKAKDRPATALEAAMTFRSFFRDPSESAGALALLLDAHFGAVKQSKKRQLEGALSRDAEGVGPVTAPASPARRLGAQAARPWVYAFIGAAVASAAVIGLARPRGPSEPPPRAIAATVASTAAPEVVTTTLPVKVDNEVAPSASSKGASRVLRIVPVHSTAPPPSSVTPTATHPPLDVDPHAI